jgi:hypothetical protein
MLHTLHPTQCQYGIPTPNRWTIRAFQSEAQTILPDFYRLPSDQLAPAVTPCPIHFQRLAKHHHQESALRTHHGAYTVRPSNFPHHYIPATERQVGPYHPSQKRRRRSSMQIASDRTPVKLCPLQQRRPGVARRKEPPYHSSLCKASA